jgi:hypothetical protein
MIGGRNEHDFTNYLLQKQVTSTQVVDCENCDRVVAAKGDAEAPELRGPKFGSYHNCICLENVDGETLK